MKVSLNKQKKRYFRKHLSCFVSNSLTDKNHEKEDKRF